MDNIADISVGQGPWTTKRVKNKGQAEVCSQHRRLAAVSLLLAMYIAQLSLIKADKYAGRRKQSSSPVGMIINQHVSSTDTRLAHIHSSTSPKHLPMHAHQLVFANIPQR